MEPIHFFRAGRHTDHNGQEITFSQADLEAIASQYDPAVHEAPLVVGHPKTDDPALGWIKAVTAKPDGLYASAADVHPEFADLVRAGAYKKVSASFYQPHTRNNPRPGSYYLRHVGFLGAMAPAVKGLRPVSFNEGAEIVDFQESTLDLREHRLQLREAEFAAREDAQRVADDAAFIDSVVRAGRLPIGLKDMATAVFAEIGECAVSFGDGPDRRITTPRALLREMLSLMPTPVLMGELAGGPLPPEEITNFAAPDGYTVDTESLAIHMDAVVHQKAHQCSYAEAVRAVEARSGRKS